MALPLSKIKGLVGEIQATLKNQGKITDSLFLVIGEVSEWSNVPDSKSGVPAMVPGVRIPPSPKETAGYSPAKQSARIAQVPLRSMLNWGEGRTNENISAGKRHPFR